MNKEHRITVEDFLNLFKTVDDDTRFVRVFNEVKNCYEDIEGITIHGNTIIIKVK